MPYSIDSTASSDFHTFIGADPVPSRDPTVSETFHSAFRMENNVMNAADLATRPTFKPTEGFVVSDALKKTDSDNGTHYWEQYRDQFMSVQSQAEFDYKVGRIRDQERDNDVMSRAGWLGTVAGISAGLVSPEIFIPLIGEYKGVAGGIKAGMAFGAAVTAPGALIKYENQETRPLSAFAMEITAGTALGGILGGAVGYFHTPAERIAAEAELHLLANPRSAAGAEVTQHFQDPGGLASGGETVSRAANATQVLKNPVLESIDQTDLTMERVIMSQISDSGVEMARNAEGIATSEGGTIENRVIPWYGTEGLTKQQENDFYADYIFDGSAPRLAPNVRASLKGSWAAGGKLSRAQFKEEITRAKWAGDVHEIPQVEAAAKASTKNTYDPMLKEAQAVGILPKDAQVVGDKGYVNRLYDVPTIQARTMEFVKALKDNYIEQLKARWQGDLEGFKLKQASRKQLAEDLATPAHELEAKIKGFQEQLKGHVEDTPEEFQHLETAIARNRAMARQIGKDDIHAEAKRAQLLKDARDMEKAAGAPYAEFKGKRAYLRQRISNLNKSVVAVGQKQAAKLERIGAIEDSSTDTLMRLTKKAQSVLRDMDKWSDEKLDAELQKLIEQFDAAGNTYRKGASKIADMVEKEDALRAKATAPAAKPYPGPDEPVPPLDPKVARAYADEKVNRKFQPIMDDINANMAKYRAELPPTLVKKLDKAIETRDYDDWHKLFEGFTTWENNGSVSDELRQMMYDLQDLVDERVMGWEREAYEKEAHKYYEGGVKAYRKLDPVVSPLDSWIEAHEANKGDLESFWRREPHDLAALKVVRKERRMTDAANAQASGDLRARIDLAEQSGKIDYEAIRQDARDDKLMKVAERLKEAESVDREAVRETIQEGLANAVEKTRVMNAKRAVRAEGLRKAAEQLDPAVATQRLAEVHASIPEATGDFARKWERMGGEGVDPDSGLISFEDHAMQAALDTKNLIVGTHERLPYIQAMDAGAKRGPELQRVLNIPSALIDPFLIKDSEVLLQAYVHTLAPDIEIARKFKTTNTEEILAKISEERDAKLQALESTVDAKGEPLTKERIEKETVRLNKAYDRAKLNISASLSRLRGTWGMPADPEGYAYRAASTLLRLNVLRQMGMVTVSSIPDLGRPVMRYGLTRTFRDGFLPYIRNLQGMQMSKEEARLAGVGWESIIHQRSSAVRDVLNDARNGSKFEKGVEYATNKLGLVAVFDHWTNAMKLITASITNTKLMDALAKVAVDDGIMSLDHATNFLAQNGINQDLALRMWGEVQQGGGAKVDGRWMPETAKWQDPELVRTYRAALAREVNNTIVTPGLEKPLWMNQTMAGRMLGQFKSFGMASTPKMLIAGLQQRDAAVLSGTMVSLALGALSYWTWAHMTGGKSLKEMQNAGIGKWADEAINRSGLIAGFGEIQRVAQTIPGLSSIASFSGGRQTKRPGDSLTETLLGPSFDAAKTAFSVISQLHSPTQSTVSQARRLLPYQNTMLIREGFDAVENAINKFVPARR